VSSLVVVGKPLFPVDSGSKVRAVNLIRAARSIGEVDVFCCVRELSPVEMQGLVDLGVRRVVVSGVGPEKRATALRALMEMAVPSALHGLPVGPLRRAFEQSGLTGHERVVLVEPLTWWLLRPAIAGVPVIVDLENVMSAWSTRVAGSRRQHARTLRGRARVRELAGAAQALVDSRRWARLERRIVETSARVIVCSDIEQARLGAPKVEVGPNGYGRPAHPVGKVDVGSPPTLVFPGKMTYEPNIDAARFLLDEILPQLRPLVPGVRVILAGRTTPELLARAEADVEVTGYVDDIDEVLARADAMVVPIRAGGGTRGKILEAWAHRLPVVSTSFGAEGLGACSDVDLLLADSPDGLAEACRRVLTDTALRARLAEAGHTRWADEFDWDQCRARIAAVLRSV
jgi:glycosyltransferase involved in cell wall biosynthesis